MKRGTQTKCSFCGKKVFFPYFTITRKFRDLPSTHHVFVGKENHKEHLNIFKKMSDGNLLTKSESRKLEKIFGKNNILLWDYAIKKNEPIIFINDRIWTDDTIFKIKSKIFVYFSDPKNRKFILPNHQQLWITSKSKNSEKKHKILGHIFEKENNQLISFPPATEIPKPDIDIEFISENNERTSEIRSIKEDSMILYDLIKNSYIPQINTPQIYLYVLDDEIEWITKNNELIEINRFREKKKFWNGYILKHWPFASIVQSPFDQNLKLFNGLKKQVELTNEIISLIRDNEEAEKKIKPELQACIIWKMSIWTRPPKIEKPYRLNMIFNYLRSLLSKDIPFIYYTKYGDKKPNIAIHEKSVESGLIKIKTLDAWIFKKISDTQKITKGRAGTILIKVLNYITNDGTGKYTTLTIYKNSEISIGLSFEEESKTLISNVEKTIKKISNLITNLNDNFLKNQNHPLFSVPKFVVKNNEFCLSEYTSIQFYQVITSFESEKVLNFNDFLDFLKIYKPFIELSFFTETNKSDKVLIKYNRTSEILGLTLIFEFIEKEKKIGSSSDVIIKQIMRRFGKGKLQSTDIYNQWLILKTDKQIAKELLKYPGVNIEIKKSDNFQIEKPKYKIFISGLKTLFTLMNAFNFFQKVLHNFFTRKIKKKLINTAEVKFDFGLPDINIDINSQNSSFDIKNIPLTNKPLNFDNFNFDNSNFNESGTSSEIKNANQSPNMSSRNFTDICDYDYEKIKLKKLTRLEPKIFNFKSKKHTQSYSRLCEISRRPMILEKNPEKNQKIKKNSYTYSIKYQSSPEKKEYYYICPQAWCPTCNVPITLQNIKNIKTKKINGEICKYGKCPNGNHDVIINTKGINDIYPGFLKPVGNPNGLCMPCCFKRDKRKTTVYRRCSKLEEVEKTKEKYISRRDKIPLPLGKFGLLPKEIEIFLEQKKCFTGNIKKGFDCLVRKGVSLDVSSNSFLNALVDFTSELLSKEISKSEFIQILISFLDKQLFESISGGLVKRVFKSQDNFKKFLLNSESKIHNSYLWDFVTRPGILIKEGFNIIVFSPHSIKCPVGIDVNTLYDLNKPTLIIIKYGNIYEPVYRLKYGEVNKELYVLQNSTDPVIAKSLQLAMKECTAYDEINWETAREYIRLEKPTKELSLKQMINELKSKKNIIIKFQIIDPYSKTTGLILNFNKNNIYVPIKPSGISMNFPVLNIKNDEDIPKLRYDKTLKLLNSLSKNNIPVKPIYYIVYKKNIKLVLGILIETGRIVPVNPILLSKIKPVIRKSDLFYYPSIPELSSIPESKIPISSSKKKRIAEINIYRFKIEAFERFKYEISQFLQTRNGLLIKKQIEYLLNNKLDKSEASVSNSKQHKKLKSIIHNLQKKLVASPSESKSQLKPFLNGDKIYSSSLIRKACFSKVKGNCKDDIHCVYSKGKCKLSSLNSESIFIDKLVDILQRFPIKRQEILEGRSAMIDIDTAINKTQENELLLTGNKIDEEFKSILKDEKEEIALKLLSDINVLQPTFEGIDKKKYLKVKEGSEKDIRIFSVVDLSQHWTVIIDPTFRFITTINPCLSIYYSYTHVIQGILKRFKPGEFKNRVEIESLNSLNFMDFYMNFLLIINSEKLKEIANIIFKKSKINKEEINGIVDSSDLFNLYEEKEKVNSVDELILRMKSGFPAYKIGKFDLIMISYMLNIKTILLRTSISEVIGNGFVENDAYCVFYYEPNKSENCSHFYLLQKNGISYVSVSSSSTIKKLLNS